MITSQYQPVYAINSKVITCSEGKRPVAIVSYAQDREDGGKIFLSGDLFWRSFSINLAY
jgi:hypothetical protein